MPFTDWPQADRNALVDAVVAGVLAATVDTTEGVTARTALARSSRTNAKLTETRKAILDDIDAATSEIIAAFKNR